MIYIVCSLALIALFFWARCHRDKYDCERRFHSKKLHKTFYASCGTWCKINDKVD